MSTKGNGQNRFGDFRFPRAGGLMHVSLLYAVSDGPSRALVVRLHAVIPPAGVQPPRHTRGARYGTHSPADGSFKPLRFGTRPLPRCRLLSLKSSSALSRVGLRGRAPHGGPQSPNPLRRALGPFGRRAPGPFARHAPGAGVPPGRWRPSFRLSCSFQNRTGVVFKTGLFRQLRTA